MREEAGEISTMLVVSIPVPPLPGLCPFSIVLSPLPHQAAKLWDGILPIAVGCFEQ